MGLGDSPIITAMGPTPIANVTRRRPFVRLTPSGVPRMVCVTKPLARGSRLARDVLKVHPDPRQSDEAPQGPAPGARVLREPSHARSGPWTP